MLSLGIDVGGSGVKGAVVDTEKGLLVTDRLRYPTPPGADAATVVDLLATLIRDLDWKSGPVGIGFPGVIRQGTICTAANFDGSLVGVSLVDRLKEVQDGPVKVINDADAAGCAEMLFGAGRPYLDQGTVLLITVGTGVGTVMFTRGVLVPNLELGHVEYKGHNAESFVSERTRKAEDLSWKRWGSRFNGYLHYLEFLLQPDFIILGGGGVKKPEKFSEQITIRTPWKIAEYGNKAGIVGAALAAVGKGV